MPQTKHSGIELDPFKFANGTSLPRFEGSLNRTHPGCLCCVCDAGLSRPPRKKLNGFGGWAARGSTRR